ncbi:DUF7662 domain-containing protein [Faunimonas sp. B44]|uniref:DUF7662 domain-containing protein n=1 Tax=Faunimonas sp. B44 TaxID=3461493 RepID=UPI0040440090
MSKYDPLREYLSRRKDRYVQMTLADVDRLVGLPASAYTHEWWWDNEDVATTYHVQCKSWQAAGYLAKVNLLARTVVFRRP